MQAFIRAIEYHLPNRALGNHELAQEFGDWKEKAIFAKTGIAERRIASDSECASDLALHAAEKLFASGRVQRSAVEALILCTQSPDHLLPTTACLLQHRLELPTTVAAFDFNLGCSGFVYGLGLAKGLIESGQVRNVLLLNADTYSKFLHPKDKSVRTLFGDGSAATWIEGRDGDASGIGPFVYGTDGSGGEHLILKGSGTRAKAAGSTEQGPCHLHMDGPEIFRFTLEAVPTCIDKLCSRTKLTLDEIDLFVFHQANAYMLEHLRQKVGIPESKFFVHIETCGNTVSSTIPIALSEAQATGRLQPGMQVMLVGFGVGLSWAATLVRWSA